MVYVALLWLPGRRNTEVGNFGTLCRSVRLFTTAYAVTLAGSILHCLAAQNNGQRPEKTDLLSGVGDVRGWNV